MSHLHILISIFELRRFDKGRGGNECTRWVWVVSAGGQQRGDQVRAPRRPRQLDGPQGLYTRPLPDSTSVVVFT